MAKVLMPIPSRDFDPTEVAVSWKVLTGMGHQVVFATPDGHPGEADRIMLDGIGLDPWSRVPGLRQLRLIGLMLRANADARRAYRSMEEGTDFRSPSRWSDLRADDFDELVLPGGHRARGMRPYLESSLLQTLTAAFFAADKPVGAICHGVLLAARSRDADGRSVLHGRRTTALTWAQERTADRFARVGRWWDADYYRTYPEGPGQPNGYMSVEQESPARSPRPTTSPTYPLPRSTARARRAGPTATAPPIPGRDGWCRTGTTCPLAGPATRTCSRPRWGQCWRSSPALICSIGFNNSRSDDPQSVV